MSNAEPWTKQLRDHCLVRGLQEPIYQDVSDRRGGRTAWSVQVLVNGTAFGARFWYDVVRLHQAKEDAAEVALRNLTGCMDISQAPPPASQYGRQGVTST